VVEPASQPLERVLGPVVGSVVAALHEANGVDLRLGEGVTSVGAAGPAPDDLRVGLSSGAVVTGERVVVGIGVAPATAWLEGSGLEIDNGVVCDATLSAAPGVVAAGDILRWPSHRYGQLLRVEHWDHAVASGEAAAARLLAGGGAATPFDPVPFFWSHQYDMKMQLVGLGGSDADAVVVGDPDEGRLVVVYGRGGSTTGVLGINRPRHVALLREAVAAGAAVEEVAANAAAL
jgi:NADPH-dependent 2,4-dienoyl-CoA reductase/sulfur reductase-like enzyme